MKILLLCNKSPYPASEGGPMAMNSIIQGLLDAGHQVKVMAVNSKKYEVTEKDIPDDYRKKTGIELIDLDLRVRPWKAFQNLFTDRSYHVERFISKHFADRLIEVLQENSYDIVQLEMLYMTPYIDVIRKYSNALIILRAHNVEHLIWERIAKKTTFFLKRWYLKHLAKTLRNYELNVLDKVDGIAAITRKDAAFFKKYCATPTVDIPYGVYPEKFNPITKVGTPPKYYHIGSMNWMPNNEGIKWFIDNILEPVVARIPDFKFYLAGRNMPEWLLNINHPNMVVVGEVPDANAFVSEHDIAIVPLLSGSGLRIKIIESMALGKTVITTLVGAEGISYTEDENIIIAETKAKMVEAICKTYQNPLKAEEIGAKARKLVETTYDNKKIIERLLVFYEQIKPSSKITVLSAG